MARDAQASLQPDQTLAEVNEIEIDRPPDPSSFAAFQLSLLLRDPMQRSREAVPFRDCDLLALPSPERHQRIEQQRNR
jgi:hypothetical protein